MGRDRPVLLENELTGKNDKCPVTASFAQDYYTP